MQEEIKNNNMMVGKASDPTPPTRSLMKEEPQTAESLLEQTKNAAKELKGLIEEHNKTLERMERFRAEEILKGKSEAGIVIKQQEETPSEYAKRILTGQVKR